MSFVLVKLVRNRLRELLFKNDSFLRDFFGVRSVLGDFITNFCRMLPFPRILRTASLKVHLHVFGVYGANDFEPQAEF
jgi:hypothetical protein